MVEKGCKTNAPFLWNLEDDLTDTMMYKLVGELPLSCYIYALLLHLWVSQIFASHKKKNSWHSSIGLFYCVLGSHGCHTNLKTGIQSRI